jgi:hypothetical protein
MADLLLRQLTHCQTQLAMCVVLVERQLATPVVVVERRLAMQVLVSERHVPFFMVRLSK